MFISCNWLRRHVDLEGQDLDVLANRFTLAVAEVEGVQHIGTGLEGVVVGHVKEVHAIEGARVQRTLVDTGGGALRQIVCGAPNVAAGQRVLVALPGAILGDMTIKEACIRGVDSSGMICGETELGLGDDDAGIMVLQGEPTPGTRLADLCDVEDTLIEIDNKSLTHRPDLWGHRGIAREVAALLGRPLKPLDIPVNYGTDTPFSIQVDDEVACPHYTATTLGGITVSASPLWLRLLLHRVGMRPINNVVDATNFIMLDLGNPLHAFDRRHLSGEHIHVRFATEGETFKTLDGVDRKVGTGDLLIADGTGGVALAGIMGGENSEIQPDTTAILLESANFNPGTVRMTSQRLGLRTESSARFEKSLDPALAAEANQAFCHLLQSLDAQVQVTSAMHEAAAPPQTPPTLLLRLDVAERRLGVPLGIERLEATLAPLGFGLERTEGGLNVRVPTFRATKDIAIEMDLVEEIGRFYGYDNIPPQHPSVSLSKPHPNLRKQFERKARHFLSGPGGFDEVMTYSFDFDPLLAKISSTQGERLVLKNPISKEMPALRTALAPNLLQLLQKNDHHITHGRFYEVGRCFEPRAGALPHQPVMLGALLADSTSGANEGGRLFFALKGILESLAVAIERPAIHLVQGDAEKPWTHPVRSAHVYSGATCLGYVAEVHPQTLRALGVSFQAAYAELDLDLWRSLTVEGRSYSPLPRFPAVFRDFAVLVGESVRAEEVRQAIFAADRARITDVTFQSVYRGAGVAAGQKSIAFSVTLRHAKRTLSDAEIRELESAIWTSLKDEVQGMARVS